MNAWKKVREYLGKIPFLRTLAEKDEAPVVELVPETPPCPPPERRTSDEMIGIMMDSVTGGSGTSPEELPPSVDCSDAPKGE